MGDRSAPRFIMKDGAQVDHFPWCRCDWITRPGFTDSQNMMLVKATMPKGDGHNFHRHPHFEEVIMVLEGKAEQWVGKEKRLLGPGDSAHIPTDEVHATYNVGDGDLVFLAMIAPCHFDGPAIIDVFDEEPWCSLHKPIIYDGYTPSK